MQGDPISISSFQRFSKQVVICTGLFFVFLAVVGFLYPYGMKEVVVQGQDALNPNQVFVRGKVVPIKSAELGFTEGGVVAEVLVEEGQKVKTGTPLLRLDDRQFVLDLERAQINLARSKSDRETFLQKVTPEQIAIAQANIEFAESQVKIAEAQIHTTESAIAVEQAKLNLVIGQVTEDDIIAAKARVEQARLAVQMLLSSPKETEVQAAKYELDQAIASLQQSQSLLSSVKSQAEAQIEIAANSLRDQQVLYSDIYWKNRDKNRDWNNTKPDLPQKSKDEEESAFRSIKKAEAELKQYQLQYEQKRQDEIFVLKEKEANVKRLQAKYDQLLQGPDPDQIAKSKADLSFAEADLAKLYGPEREANIAIARSNIEVARSQLAKDQANLASALTAVKKAKAELDLLTVRPAQSSIESMEFVVKHNEVLVNEAKLHIEKMVLRAPFDGTVIKNYFQQGSLIGIGKEVMIFADLDHWEIRTQEVSEQDVTKIREGYSVKITFDAIPGLALTGKIKRITSSGVMEKEKVLYDVIVAPDQWDERLRWGMTANLTIDLNAPKNPMNQGQMKPEMHSSLTPEGNITSTPENMNN